MKGHQWLPNELLDLVMDKRLKQGESRLLLYVGRKTYGFHRKSYKISRKEFSKDLEISFKYVTDLQNWLTKSGFLILLNKGNSAYNYSEWAVNTDNKENKFIELFKIPERNRKMTGKPWLTSKHKLTSEHKLTQLVTPKPTNQQRKQRFSNSNKFVRRPIV